MINIIETNLDFRSLTPMQAMIGFVLHHTGAEDVDLSAAEIHQMHLNNGWSGIGYHFVFRKDGTIERGRPQGMQGAHCPGTNGTRWGLHFCGCFSAQLPNELQLASAVAFISEHSKERSLNPLDDSVILGHRDFLATECPGQMFYDHIPILRQKVAEA